MMKNEPITVRVTMPGYTHNFALHGHPEAGEVYQLQGRPAVSLILGNRINGASDRPGLVVTSLGELDELAAAIVAVRARLALWIEDHKGAG